MNNPYNILNEINLPENCMSLVMSFYRPNNGLVDEIKGCFFICEKCREPVGCKRGLISLKYYTIERGCGDCNKPNKIVCKDCIIRNDCSCKNDDEDSW